MFRRASSRVCALHVDGRELGREGVCTVYAGEYNVGGLIRRSNLLVLELGEGAYPIEFVSAVSGEGWLRMTDREGGVLEVEVRGSGGYRFERKEVREICTEKELYL